MQEDLIMPDAAPQLQIQDATAASAGPSWRDRVALMKGRRAGAA